MSTPEALSESALGAQLLKHLLAGVRNRALYPARHPEVRAPAQGFADAIAASQAAEVTLAVVDGDAYLDGAPLRSASLQYADFLRELGEREVEVLRFVRGVSADDVAVLVDVLARPADEVLEPGGVADLLEAAGVVNVAAEHLVRLPGGRFELLQDVAGEGEAGGGAAAAEVARPEDPLEPPVAAQRAYGAAVEAVGLVYTRVSNAAASEAVSFESTEVTSIAGRLVSDLLDDPSAFLGLLHLRGVSEDLFQHGVNTAILAVLLGSKLDLEEEQLRILGIAGLLHDLGELFVPQTLRQKPGPLTDAEWKLVHEHPTRGAKLIIGTGGLDPLVATVALEHHAGYRGHGYPKLHARQRIHLFSRIVALADAYDALTHPRPYQDQPDRPFVTDRLLELAGSKFDATVVKILLHTVGFHPPGTPVRLSDGRDGVVQAPTPGQPFLPRVVVPRDESFDIVDTAELGAGGAPAVTIAARLGRAAIPAPTAAAAITSRAAA